jgi:spore coat protein CotH
VGALVCLAVVIVMAPAQSAAPAASSTDAQKRYVPGAPVPVYITTEGGAPITSRDDYVNGVMLLDGVNHAMEIRGRGNSTWMWPKKPYKIKLANDVALLGTEPRDEWVLLANYADRSALRTFLAMGLASSSGLPWTPRTRFVDVVLNGVPQGLYLLTDQVEQGTERVDLPDGSYLLEVNSRFRRQGDPGFWSEHDIPISYKDPDELKKSERKLVRTAIHRFEKALYGKNFADPKYGYRAHIDLDSFINWYLVEELFHNQDSNFFSSVHFTWTPGGDIAMGPVWDFDLSAGTKWNGTSLTEGYYTRYGRDHWIRRMFEDPAFTAAVKQRWAELRPVVDAMVAEIPVAANVIRSSALNNWAIWPTTTETELVGSVHADTFDGEVSYLANWLTARAAWMSADEVIFDMPSAKVRERPHVINVPVRILGDQTRPATVAYALTSSTATLGKDFTVTAGELTFGPGETVKTFPVRILADRKPERRETINLELVAASGVRLDNPSTVRITIKKNDQRVR